MRQQHQQSMSMFPVMMRVVNMRMNHMILSEVDLLYSLKFVNPQKKSEYTIRKWHIKQKFTTVGQLASKLIESFDVLHPMDVKVLNHSVFNLGTGSVYATLLIN